MFRLNKAELIKIFNRPAVYILIAFLAIALVFTAISYSPVSTRNDKLTNFGSNASDTVNIAWSSFENDVSNPDSKENLDKHLLITKQGIENYDSSSGVYETLHSMVENIKNELTKNDGNYFFCKHHRYSGSDGLTGKDAYISALTQLKSDSYKIYSYCRNNINASNINFFYTKSDLENLKNFFYQLQLSIPNPAQFPTDKDKLLEIGNKILHKYDPSSYLQSLENAEKFNLTEEKINKIIEDYYTHIAYNEGSNTTLTVLYEDAKTFALENKNDKTAEKKLELNQLITKYKNATLIASSLLENSFNIKKIGAYTTADLKNFIGFENYNTYSIKEIFALNSYLLENQIFDGDYLLNFNFNQISGNNGANAYDFTVYAMQILSVIVTVFSLFFAVSITAGDYQNGTLKMLATRPFTRRQIISGKTLSCINFMLIFILFSAVASFIVGACMFDLETKTVLAIINSNIVVPIPDFCMILVYLATILVDVIFYILIAFLLAIIFRSSVFSLFCSLVVYFIGIIFNALCATQYWFAFTPFAYLEWFKFFGNASTTSGFLTFSITTNANLYISCLITLVVFIVIDSVTKSIFKSRDIA